MATNDVKKYGCSIDPNDEEDPGVAGFDTRQAAIDAAPVEFELKPGEKFHTYSYEQTKETYCPIAERVIEQAQEWAMEETEASEAWLEDVPSEAVEDLRTMLAEVWESWLKAHNLLPDWSDCDEYESHVVPTGRRAPVLRCPLDAEATIAWEEHEEAWEAYRKKFGNDQSAERIADRGGFGESELVLLLGHAPKTLLRKVPK